MALNVDILSVNSLFINGVDILSNKRDYVELVGDEKIVIDVPSTTYTKVVPQSGVNLGDVELKTTPLDGKTFDSINNAGGVSVDGVSHIVDVNGCYVSNINIDSFVLNKTSVIKSLDYTTYKWHDVDYGKYDLALTGNNSLELNSNALVASTPNPTNYTDYSVNIVNNGTNITDSVHNVATIYNTATISNTVKFNNQSTIALSSSRVTMDSTLNSYLPSGTGDFTIESWLYYNGVGGDLFTVGTVGVDTCYGVYIDNTRIIFSLGNGGWGWSTHITAYTTIPTSSWSHIVVQRKSGILSFFVNGTKLPSTSLTSNLRVTGRLHIGSYFESSNEQLGAYIGTLKMYKSAKYDSNFTVDLTQSPYPYIPTDISVLSSSDKVEGVSSYEFNGTNYITAPSNPKYAFGTDDFTIELYTKVKYLDATYGTTILDNRPDNTNGAYWFIGMTKDGFLFIFTNNTAIITGTTNQFNKWCHIALVRKDGVTSLYVNGIKEGSTSTLYSYSGDTFKIGRNAFYPTVPLLQGLIDDLRITKGLARYTTNFTPSTTLDTGTRPVKVAQHQGTIIQSELSYSDYLVSYGAEIDPWVAVQPSITVSGEPFTTAVTSITSSSTFTSVETFNIGDIISSDKETFGTVIFEENGEFMVDADIFFDGVTDKPFTPSDANIVNFVKDKRSNLYTNGLRDALLSSVSSTIYGHINDEIIVDAGEGGSFIIGTMYTSGGYQDTDTTSKFSISLSNDGVDYTVVYENQENLMTNHAHNMTGTGRFIKITFLNEIGSWGRIITNFVGGKWWDLHIVHPMSKVYRYAARLEVNGKSIVPNYIQWFDNMTINKIVCDKVFINPTTVLNINTENISKVELDLWQEVKGVL